MIKSHIDIAVKGIKWTTIGTILKSIFQLLQIVILTRYISKESFGDIAMALFIINFTNIFVDFGLSSAILHFQNYNPIINSSIFWINILISIALFTILLICTPLLSEFYDNPNLNYIVPILGFNIILQSFGKVHQTILQKEFRFKEISIIESLSYFLGLLVAIILALTNFDIFSLIISTLISSFCLNFLFFLTNIKKHKILFTIKLKQVFPYLKIGLYTTINQVISYFSTDVDILIIGKMLGNGPLGIYSLSKQIILKVYSIINPIITKVLSPLLSDIQNNNEELKKYFLKSSELLSSINCPIYFIIVIYSYELLKYLYGPSYSSNYILLSCIAINYLTLSMLNPVGSLHIATGRTDLGLFWSIFSLLITPIYIYFASLYNIEIVGFAKVLMGLVIIFPMWIIQIKPILKIKFIEYLETFIRPLILVIILSTLFIISYSFFQFSNSITFIILKGIIFLSLYLVLTILIDYKRISLLINILRKLLIH